MIYFTGDTHGDITRFKGLHLKKRDTLIICGDFGFLWDGGKKERKTLKWIGKRRYTVLFVEGVHENFEQLATYPQDVWCGGNTRIISGKLRQLMRGQVYEIANRRIFAFGGGRSDDADIPSGSEVPTDEELSEGMRLLCGSGDKVDYIVSYEPPSKLTEFLEIGKTDRCSVNVYLEQIRERVAFTRWFFGRHHINKQVPPKYYALFTDVTDENGNRHGKRIKRAAKRKDR